MPLEVIDMNEIIFMYRIVTKNRGKMQENKRL